MGKTNRFLWVGCGIEHLFLLKRERLENIRKQLKNGKTNFSKDEILVNTLGWAGVPPSCFFGTFL